MEKHDRSMSLQDVLLVLFRQKRVIVGVYAGVLVASLVGLFLLSPKYRSAARILLTSDRAQVSTSAERPPEIVRTTQVSDAEIDSQLQILRSRDLVGDVLREMRTDGGLDASSPDEDVLAPGLFQPLALVRQAYRRLHGLADPDGSSASYWEIRAALARLDAGRLGSSNVLEVGFTGNDPRWAALFVNRLVDAYVERHARMPQVVEAEGFFTEQSDLLRGKLTASETALKEVRARLGGLAGREAEVVQQLNRLSTDLSQTAVERGEQQERVDYFERLKAGSGPGKVATPELLQLEAQRAQLVGRYRPDSERVRDLDDQIARLRVVIRSYDTVLPGPTGTNANGSNLLDARARLASLRGRERALEREVETYRKQAERLGADAFELSRLERQVKLDEEAYLSYVRAAEQSRLSSAIEQSKLLRLSIIEPAVIPAEPVGPKRGAIFVFGAAGGLVLALGLAFARDRFDPTVRTPDEAQQCAPIEVLTMVPDRT
jgi:succinoglycan biosynthesis transport protein ExoP